MSQMGQAELRWEEEGHRPSRGLRDFVQLYSSHQRHAGSWGRTCLLSQSPELTAHGVPVDRRGRAVKKADAFILPCVSVILLL